MTADDLLEPEDVERTREDLLEEDVAEDVEIGEHEHDGPGGPAAD